MRCDECGKKQARKVFVSWLCRIHAIRLLTSVGWLKPKPVFDKPCDCKCHIESPFNWCDSCWNNKEHGIQLYPLKTGLIKENGQPVTEHEVDQAIEKYDTVSLTIRTDIRKGK